MAEFQSAQITVVAGQFNPSIIDKHWLIHNGILTEADFLPNCVFAPIVSHVNSRHFVLIAVPDRLQFAPQGDGDGQESVNKLCEIIALLPHTPYAAAGINFHWRTLVDRDLPEVSRDLFFCKRQPFASEFDVPDANFGAYFSKDVLGGRLKLNVRPAKIKSDSEQKTAILLEFNFHFELNADDASSNLIEVLQHWGEAKALAERFAGEVETQYDNSN